MNSRFRIKLISLIAIALLTGLSSSLFAQNRGGGGGGGGGQQDPAQMFATQLKLTGKTKTAFIKAFNDNLKNQRKSAADQKKFESKYAKYQNGKKEASPEIIEQANKEKAELLEKRKANSEAYATSLNTLLSDKQRQQLGQIQQRWIEQQKRRAANQQKGKQGNQNSQKK